MSALATVQQGFFQLQKDAFNICKRIFLRVYPIALILAAIWIIPFFILPKVTTVELNVLISYIETHYYFLPIFSAFIFYAYTLLFQRSNDCIHEKNHLIENIVTSLKLFPSVLMGLVITGAVLFPAYMFYYLPGVVLSIFLALYLPLIMCGMGGPLSAFAQSFKLVWWHWWHTFATLLIPSIIFLIVTLIVEVSTADVLTIAHVTGGEIWVLNNLVRMIVASFYMLYIVTLLIVLINDLSLRK